MHDFRALSHTAINPQALRACLAGNNEFLFENKKFMELTLSLGYGQIINLINQLPANQIAKIKQEFTESYIADKAKTEISDFQQFLLSGPVMSEEQYLNFNQQRQHFNAWRVQ